MKTEQILLALAIDETGTVSAAAKTMMLAQSNASSMLLALEEELGYRIFRRMRKGMIPTVEGEAFLQYARVIERSLDEISKLGTEPPEESLAIISYEYAFVDKAFARLCKNHLDSSKKMRFVLKPITTMDDAFLLMRHMGMDIAITTCLKEIYGSYMKRFERSKMEGMIIGSLPLTVVFKEDHPLARQKKITMRELSEYPCITNGSLTKDNVPPDVWDMINRTRINIQVKPGRGRKELMKVSNSYIICTPYERETLKEQKLTSRILPNSERYLFAITKSEGQNHILAQEFLGYVKEEFPLWVKST